MKNIHKESVITFAMLAAILNKPDYVYVEWKNDVFSL